MKPFLQGRPVHQQSKPLRPLGGSGADVMASITPHPHAGETNVGPTVECVKQGEKVVRLVITCTCGERIEVECLYPAGG